MTAQTSTVTDQPTVKKTVEEKNKTAEGVKILFAIAVLALAVFIVVETDHGGLRKTAMGNIGVQ
ncbi:hypothetical protein N0V84_008107 [Fusarium piperis]|uniref:Uncharacterized protein n=1 Tax=Fusarium piperis TaxID=1435070 RepID=A0A9W8W8U5_9HYPO|nr:hypothetical protein N0V84_008107 [Fusarium piperis]